MGRCPACGEWNSLVEEVAAEPEQTGPGTGGRAFGLRRHHAQLGVPHVAARSPVALADVDPDSASPFATGLAELDRVLSGGLIPGSVTLVGGEPGIGKSTLVLQAAFSLAALGAVTLVVAAEESAEQVRRRASRLGPIARSCYVVATTDLVSTLNAVAETRPRVLVVDSIQAIADPLLPSAPGSTAQVRECACALVELAKATGTAVVLVGHVTKDGSLAGPRTLEHLVDTVLTFEGDRHHTLRLLVATKHRFGPTGELGVFEMGDEGLVCLEDPGRLLLERGHSRAPGTVVVPTAEGRRPLLVEVQVLVTDSHGAAPRRVVEGVPGARAALMLAVIERCLGLRSGSVDMYCSTVGAVRVQEPAADLGLALAIVSAMTGRPIPADVVVFGELALTGEVRHTPRSERRLFEASRLGFRRAVAPAGCEEGLPPLDVLPARTLAEAATLVNLVAAVEEPPRKSPDGGLPFNSKLQASRFHSSQDRGLRSLKRVALAEGRFEEGGFHP